MKTNLNFARLCSSVCSSHRYCVRAQRPRPAVAAATLPHRIPEGIEHDKERIAPLPGVVILEQAAVRFRQRCSRYRKLSGTGLGK